MYYVCKLIDEPGGISIVCFWRRPKGNSSCALDCIRGEVKLREKGSKPALQVSHGRCRRRWHIKRENLGDPESKQSGGSGCCIHSAPSDLNEKVNKMRTLFQNCP